MLLTIALAAALQVAPAVTAAEPGQADAPPAAASPSGDSDKVEEPAKTFNRDELFPSMLHAAVVAGERRMPRDDSRDQAERMLASDRDEGLYFNRPDATPAVFEQEWHECRQIARRLASSRSDGAVASSAYAQGGLVGGLLVGGLDAAFSERRARRDIRRECLIVRGWRMIEPDEAGRARIAALPRAERDAFYDRALGAAEIEPGATVTDVDVLIARWEERAAGPRPKAEDGEP